jgi:hypothetical protein
MKKILFSLLLLQSTISYSYELISFSSARVRANLAEILNETGINKDKLTPFRCDNTERFDLFSTSLIQNMAKDSLKIIGQDGTLYTYSNGGILETTKVKDTFVKKVLATLKRFESVPETQRLVEELQFSPYKFYIKLGGPRYLPHEIGQRSNMHGNDATFIANVSELRPFVDGMPFSQIGFGGHILWNPNFKSDFVEEDYKKRGIDADIVLAHEMYHAYDGMRGLLDRRQVSGDDYEFQEVCEYRAVRMENIVRKAFGYKYRRFYSEPSDLYSAKDMLDDHNEPVVIPTPCVHLD